jgi:putative redox protein
MTSTVVYKGDLRTECTHLQSSNTIITDAPTDNHGKGEAFSPTDLIATALASCMITTMGLKAAAMNVDITNTKAEVTKIMASEPRRIAEVIVKITMPASLSDKEREIFEHTAHHCPISQSIKGNVIETVSFEYV